MPKKNTTVLRTSILLFICFALPCAILFLVYICYGFAPFGDKSLLIMDMSAQYSEFFCGLKQIGANSGGVLFSWSKVLGSNYAGVFAYYVSSPLSFLTLLCPNDKMPIGLLYLTVLKIGLCGLSFGIMLNFMRRKSEKASLPILQNRIYIVLFSVCYALMSYNIVYSMSLMWLDAVIWLPIIIIGIEKILDGGKSPLLFISFTVLFLSTYYISYMVGIFSCIYFLFGTLRKKRIALRDTFSSAVRFIASAAAAACAGAWLLLPTLYSLFEGKINGTFMSSASGVNYEFTDVFRKLFIGNFDSITNTGMPFFYCGIIVIAFYFAFYFTKSVHRDEKIMTALITFFLLISTYFTKLDVMWHVFQKPNWFPYRYSFIITFFIIFTAVKGFVRIREIPHACFIVFFALAGVFYRYMMDLPASGVTAEQFRYSVIFLIAGAILIFAAVLFARLNVHRAVNSVIWILMLCLSVNEVYVNARYLTEDLDGAHRYESYEKYHEYKQLTEYLASEADADANGEFYRMGADFQRNFNESIGLGYGGMSHYSSSYNKNINSFLYKLGFAQVYFWSSYAGSTVVTDSLFSVKYVMTDPDIARMDDSGRVISWCRVPYAQYKILAQKDTAALYENPYVLPPCIAVSNTLKNFNWRANGVESQNFLLNCMLNNQESYFIRMSGEEDGAVRMKQTGDCLEYTVTAPEDGPLYAYFPMNSNSVCEMSVDGGYDIKLYTGETNCVQFLGSYSAGDSVTIRISGSHLNFSGNAFYLLDMRKFESAVDTLRESALEISEWSSGSLKGTLQAKTDGTVFTGLVYDKSWKVTVDGREVETAALADGLLCFDITAGAHKIEIKYCVPGFAAGMTVTAVTVTACAVLCVIKIIRKRKLRRG